jgi:molybdopterin-binding protein
MSARRNPAGALGLAENVCLALIGDGVEHGWAVGSILAPDGEMGRIWSLSRPLTYRAIDQLVERGQVKRRGTEQGRGRGRTLLRITAAGRRTAARWLDEPVEHLRDVRIELLLKLALRARAGLAVAPLLEAQRGEFSIAIDALTSTTGDEDLVDLWRREHARAVRRFLDAAIDPDRGPATEQVRARMRLSARNQLAGIVTGVAHGDVMSAIHVCLADGQRLTAAITKDAAEDLDLAPGEDVVGIVKSTDVILAKP